MKWLRGLWDSCRERLASCWSTLCSGIRRFFTWHGTLRTPVRMAVDVAIAGVVILAWPLLAVGLAATCFTDRLDSVGALLSMIAAAAFLEVIGLWAIELLLPLVAIQVGRVTTRYLDNVELREHEYRLHLGQ